MRILRWSFWVVHLFLLIGAFGYVIFVVAQLEPIPRMRGLAWYDHLTTAAWAILCFLSAHRLLRRKSHAATLYLAGSLVYTANVVGKYVVYLPSGKLSQDHVPSMMANLAWFVAMTAFAYWASLKREAADT